jgi:hypothetical protein
LSDDNQNIENNDNKNDTEEVEERQQIVAFISECEERLKTKQILFFMCFHFKYIFETQNRFSIEKYKQNFILKNN